MAVAGGAPMAGHPGGHRGVRTGYAGDMAVLQVVVPDEVAERLARRAQSAGLTSEEAAADAVATYALAPDRHASPSPGQPRSGPSPDDLDRLAAFAQRKAADPEAARFRAEVAAQRASGVEFERLGRRELLARQRALHQA